MRILLFTDSLSLPRHQPEHCDHNSTWPELLRKEGHEVCLSAIGGATIKTLFKQTFYFKNTNYFDVIIVQCGIVDCAPRFVKNWELKILQRLPLLGRPLLRLLNKNHIRRIRKITYTRPKEFEHYLDSFVAEFSCPVWFVPILPARPAYEQELPGIQRNIEQFNQLISKNTSLSLDSFPPEGLMSDHHHLNELGHAFLKDLIIQKIKNELS